MSGAASSNISVKIGFDDQALDRIPAANKKIQSLETSAGRAAKGIQNLATHGGTDKLSKGMRGLARESLAAFENIGRIMGPLEVITGAASIAGLARLTSEWAGLTTQLGYSAQRAGIGVGQLTALQGAATLVGVSAQSLTAGMTALNDNLTNAATGRAPEAIAAFNYLHIALRGANGQLRSSVSVLPEIADRLAAVKNPAIQAQLATELLGGAAADLLPFLRQGSAGIAKLSQEAQTYGNRTAQDVAISTKFTRQQGELTLAIGGLTNALGERLAPALGNTEEQLAGFIRNNKDSFATAVTDWKTYLEAFAIYMSSNWIKRIGSILAGALPKLLGGVVGAGLNILLDPNTSIQSGADEEAALRAAVQRMNVERAKEGLPALPMPVAQPAGLSQQVYQQNDDAARLPAKQAAANMATARQFFLSHGWSAAQTAGILANAAAESGFNPKQVGDGGTSVGLLQWHNERAAQMQAWAKAHGMDPSSLAAQLAYAQWDLTQGPNKATGQALKQTNDPVQAGMLFTQQYERPAGGDAEAYRRGQTAPMFLPPPDNNLTKGVQHSALGPSTADVIEHRPPSRQIPVEAKGIAEPSSTGPGHIGPEDWSGPGDSAGPYYPKPAPWGDGLPPSAIIDGPSGPRSDIAGGTGAPPASASETTVKGSATVTVHLKGAPPGTRTSATSDGELFANAGPVKVQTSSVGEGTSA